MEGFFMKKQLLLILLASTMITGLMQASEPVSSARALANTIGAFFSGCTEQREANTALREAYTFVSKENAVLRAQNSELSDHVEIYKRWWLNGRAGAVDMQVQNAKLLCTIGMIKCATLIAGTVAVGYGIYQYVFPWMKAKDEAYKATQETSQIAPVTRWGLFTNGCKNAALKVNSIIVNHPKTSAVVATAIGYVGLGGLAEYFNCQI